MQCVYKHLSSVPPMLYCFQDKPAWTAKKRSTEKIFELAPEVET